MQPRPMRELSGVQRDLVAAVGARPAGNGREIWTAIEQLRQETIKDATVYRNLDELAEQGLVAKDTGGAENQYRLTLEGRDLLDREADWLAEI